MERERDTWYFYNITKGCNFLEFEEVASLVGLSLIDENDDGSGLHKQKTMVIDWSVAFIDEEIYSLIAVLNHLGYRTKYCCQGSDEGNEKHWAGLAYVSFSENGMKRVLRNEELMVWARDNAIIEDNCLRFRKNQISTFQRIIENET